MSPRRLRRSILPLCLGFLAIFASAFQQGQLASNVAWAVASHGTTAVADIQAHTDHDIAVAEQAAMPDDCPMHQKGGHTHRGHADCAVCGPQGTIASFTLTAVAFVPIPPSPQGIVQIPVPASETSEQRPSPYSSRAPPLA